MALGAALALLAAASQPGIRLTDIRMHLFYEAKGRLSPDLTRQQDFAGWNATIGGGSAEEPANDLLVAVEVSTAGDKFVRTPLKVFVRDSKGKTLASRIFATFLIPAQGSVYLPLWVRDAGCAGEIKVDAYFNKQHRTESLGLQCGE